MRISRGVISGAITTVVALSAAVVGLTDAAVAAAPSPPYNSVSIDGGTRNTGVYVLWTSAVYDGNVDSFTIYHPPAPDSVRFWVSRTTPSGGETLVLTIAPPIGQSWTENTTYPAGYYASATDADFDISTGGYGCDARVGSTLTITQVRRDEAGVLTGIAGKYSVNCEQGPPVTGELHWNSTVEHVLAASSSNRVLFGSQPTGTDGTSKVLTYTARGSNPVTYGTAALGGDTPAAFAITADSCSGKTFTYGETCTVTVTPRATALGTQTASLTIPDNTLGGQRFAHLELAGVDGRQLTITPGSLDFGMNELGEQSAPSQLTVKSTGALAVTFGSATLEGAQPGSFVILSDTCSGQTVNPGSTCVLEVAAKPTAIANQNAYVKLPNNSIQGSHNAYLTAYGEMPQVGTYFGRQPYRVLDTRTGRGAPKTTVKAGGVVHLKVGGVAWVPVNATAVVLNVTVSGPSARSYLSVYPGGGVRPTVSSLNFPKGWTGANSVTVATGPGGYVDIYNAAGSTNIIADVVGYYAGNEPSNYEPNANIGGEYQPFKPVRLLDTRKSGGKLPGGYYIQLPANFGAAVNSHVKAFAVNVTAVSPSGTGFFTTWNGAEDLPASSTLNFTKNATVANFAIVPTTPCVECSGSGYLAPSIAIYTSTAAHVIVDIFGFYDDSTLGDGLRFQPLTPERIADSRSALGTPSAIPGGATAVIAAPPSVLDTDTVALALNVTAINPTKTTYLTVWPNGISGFGQPGVSNVNAGQGAIVPNAVISIIGPTNSFNVFNAGRRDRYQCGRGRQLLLLPLQVALQLLPLPAASGSGQPRSERSATRTRDPSGEVAVPAAQ
ncbi:hypothetical protein F4553_004202 [Allocatelliglobosispora scoriae]|uniref:Choice-of-anchor D domain-containing protein n=1 Tax=Allocatelliglobosispora scoriae TaxID=643052 RepID=A0A841BV83_9ACTN|nr:choice-of-anchor D domain-containing protein [Allocatelliglobosispora scoriae]MBB5870823.1 hypothetical protein [Allocatelliglobosispora scoriae]